MDKQTLRTTLYAAILELLDDPKYYYASNVGKDYSELTENGKKAVADVIEMYAYDMLQAKRTEDEERSKSLVIDQLKKVN